MLNMLEPVEELRGIGPKTGEILRKAGIRTVGDFFYNLPRDYENYIAPSKISEVRPGKVVVRGRIEKLATRPARRRNLTVTEGEIRDETGAIKVVWFNQSYRARQFTPGKEYYFTGNFELKNGRYSLISPSVAEVAQFDTSEGLRPIYVAHGKLSSQDFRRLVRGVKERFFEIPDLLPGATGGGTGVGQRDGLPATGARREALFNAHFPETEVEVRQAREYLTFEELFELILASRLNREENQRLRAEALPFEATPIREFVGRLPFQLTNAQRRAAWEIFQDMAREVPMNRLLQGDVGSGKTMVAALAAYEAILRQRQVALLAPTAILAGQHFAGLNEILGQFGVRTALLTGATKGKVALKKQIASGEIDLVIGTHALLTDDTEFEDLALVVIDEQHRFGVKQRQKLVMKSREGRAPHLLTMTATPIPRSLQLTLFGDLDVSILDELPKGRKAIQTKVLPGIETQEKVYPKIREVLKAGQQVYWVCKAIEDGWGGTLQTSFSGTASPPPVVTGAARLFSPVGSERPEKVSLQSSDSTKSKGSDPAHPETVQKKSLLNFTSELTSVKKRARKLKQEFPNASIEILHGKMKPAEKDAVMERFSRGEIEVLVATTVVEVGVDVPNATLMVIENAESYGLAQLHQLRGRVGRGSAASFCYLLTSGDVRPTRRLREMEKSSDGFYLAEVDLKLRGPGEIYGALQHGALDLRIASLSDTRAIARAQKAVEGFLARGGFGGDRGDSGSGASGKSDSMEGGFAEGGADYIELRARIRKYQQITTLN